MMNQDSRRLSRITDDIRMEYEQYCPIAPRSNMLFFPFKFSVFWIMYMFCSVCILFLARICRLLFSNSKKVNCFAHLENLHFHIRIILLGIADAKVMLVFR